jgi:hypothetical protein
MTEKEMNIKIRQLRSNIIIHLVQIGICCFLIYAIIKIAFFNN